MEIDKGDLSKGLVSIDYPGVVKNELKAFETMGGIRTVSSIYCGRNRRLELRMRPDDVFCKPAFANRRPVTAIVFKIRIKRKKREITHCEVLGHVAEEYKFTGLCDFQYLATSKSGSIYDTIVPKDLDLRWLKGECPFFLQPTAFSRTDTVQNFNFSKVSAEENRPNVIGRLKRKRFGCTKCVTFENPDVPAGPKINPIGGKWPAKIVTKDTLDLLIQLFSTRPVYSKTAIMCMSKMSSDDLKCLLPCVAYFFVNGPWRSLWVRFGYDPRKDPSSRIYQTLDYRVRRHFTKEEKQMFRRKKETFCSPLSIKYTNQSSKSVAVITRNLGEASEKDDDDDKTDAEDHIFRPGVIPPSRQCLYQYCDLHVPEIQAMIDNLPSVDAEMTCNEVHGWLPPGMSESCREIMNRYIAEEIRRRTEMNHPSQSIDNHSQQSSASESDSSDGPEVPVPGTENGPNRSPQVNENRSPNSKDTSVRIPDKLTGSVKRRPQDSKTSSLVREGENTRRENAGREKVPEKKDSPEAAFSTIVFETGICQTIFGRREYFQPGFPTWGSNLYKQRLSWFLLEHMRNAMS